MKYGFEGLLFQLVSHRFGARKNDVAVLIPSYDGGQDLSRHLRILSRQSRLNFDVVILGKPASSPPKNLNIVVYSENYRLGSSGGFGIGRLLCFALGYKHIINSDVDCLPISRNLVEKLVQLSKKERKMVLPLTTPTLRMGKQGKVWGGTNQYGCAPREVLERHGFDFFRLYRGAEDHEMFARLSEAGALLTTTEARVLHKSHIFDYVSLLKARGNKYIYYKRSAIIANTLLASRFFRQGKLAAGLNFSAAAFFDVIETQLFYARYPDILWPVYQGLFLDLEGMSLGRTTLPFAVKIPLGAKPLVICDISETVFGAVRFGKSGNAAKDALSALWLVLEIILSGKPYLAPTRMFLDKQAFIIPLLIMLKPMRYTDGAVYSSGMGGARTALNVIFTAAASPLLLLAFATSLAKAAILPYPPTIKNAGANLSAFLQYVRRLKSEEKRQGMVANPI